MEYIGWKKGLFSSMTAVMLVAGSWSGQASAAERDAQSGIQSAFPFSSAVVQEPATQWEKKLDGIVSEITGVSLIEQGKFSFGGLGQRNSYNEFEHAVLGRMDEQGNLEWSRELELREPYYHKIIKILQVKPAEDGGYIIAGEVPSFHFRYTSGYIAKTDRNGDLL
ncbi:hypothetical protein [Paenibacillus sp. J22TS3]|uniref:hypothetical protein n=1 Tax=Paenibacillus sp. J22TS3 TaxID=2807192 RepID=UPI001B008F52|nr:hypothetical protein [Paenibacillus sp. J22TS3]GIP22652.1 hypothetical protein J22TS3_29270 [Paenibacillus sp. J22TS3]